MQTLVFNTTAKTVKLYEGHQEASSILLSYENIPTVRVSELGFYEVIQKDEFDKNIPILRVPISNTNMVIKK